MFTLKLLNSFPENFKMLIQYNILHRHIVNTRRMCTSDTKCMNVSSRLTYKNDTSINLDIV